jgi:hypothetical protein
LRIERCVFGVGLKVWEVAARETQASVMVVPKLKKESGYEYISNHQGAKETRKEGEYESASHKHGESGKDEAHIEDGVLYQPLGELATFDIPI